MSFKKIKTKKIYEEVADELYEMIKDGRLKPGEKMISIQQLAENFDVGRSAIREALTALSSMGLVEMRQGEGTFIKEFDPSLLNAPLSTGLLMDQKDLANLLEVRKILEVGTAAAAARKRTEADLQELRNLLLTMKEAARKKEIGDEADLNFHILLAKASRNEILINLMNHISETMAETMRETRQLYMKESLIEELYEEHVEIFQAIEAGDEAAAQSAMHKHISNVESLHKKNSESY